MPHLCADSGKEELAHSPAGRCDLGCRPCSPSTTRLFPAAPFQTTPCCDMDLQISSRQPIWRHKCPCKHPAGGGPNPFVWLTSSEGCRIKLSSAVT